MVFRRITRIIEVVLNERAVHIYEKNIQFLLRCSKKSIHCARNHKGKGEQQQDSDYFEDFEVNQFINLKL